jgi:hypothetical protein
VLSVNLSSGRGQDGCQNEVRDTAVLKCEPEQWKGTGWLSRGIRETSVFSVNLSSGRGQDGCQEE